MLPVKVNVQHSIIIRNATVADLKVFVECSSLNEFSLWHGNVHDLDIWLKAFDGSAFLTAVDTSSGLKEKPVGFCFATPHHPGNNVMIHCYFVLPEYRGRSIGSYLFNEVVDRFPSCNICLRAGTPSMVPKYAGLCGLSLKTNDQVRLVYGRPLSNTKVEKSWQKRKILIKQIDESNIGDVKKFDRSICGVERDQWCHKWMMDDKKGIGMVAFFENGVVAGYRQLRRCNDELYRLGPLYAMDLDTAMGVLYELLEQRGIDKQKINIFAFPMANDEKTKQLMCSFIQLTSLSELIPLMSKNKEVEQDTSKVYMIADTEANFI